MSIGFTAPEPTENADYKTLTTLFPVYGLSEFLVPFESYLGKELLRFISNSAYSVGRPCLSKNFVLA